MPAGLEVGFDPFLECHDPLLLERSHRLRGESLELEIGKGRAAPDLERGSKPFRPLGGILGCSRLGSEIAKAVEVHLLRSDCHAYPGALVTSVSSRASCAAGRRSSEATWLPCGRTLTPEDVDQTIGRTGRGASSRSASTERCFRPPGGEGPSHRAPRAVRVIGTPALPLSNTDKSGARQPLAPRLCGMRGRLGPRTTLGP